MFKVVVRYDTGSEGEFGSFDNRNVAMQLLAILASKSNVLSATIEESRVIG